METLIELAVALVRWIWRQVKGTATGQKVAAWLGLETGAREIRLVEPVALAKPVLRVQVFEGVLRAEISAGDKWWPIEVDGYGHELKRGASLALRLPRQSRKGDWLVVFGWGVAPRRGAFRGALIHDEPIGVCSLDSGQHIPIALPGLLKRECCLALGDCDPMFAGWPGPKALEGYRRADSGLVSVLRVQRGGGRWDQSLMLFEAANVWVSAVQLEAGARNVTLEVPQSHEASMFLLWAGLASSQELPAVKVVAGHFPEAAKEDMKAHLDYHIHRRDQCESPEARAHLMEGYARHCLQMAYDPRQPLEETGRWLACSLTALLLSARDYEAGGDPHGTARSYWSAFRLALQLLDIRRLAAEAEGDEEEEGAEPSVCALSLAPPLVRPEDAGELREMLGLCGGRVDEASVERELRALERLSTKSDVDFVMWGIFYQLDDKALERLLTRLDGALERAAQAQRGWRRYLRYWLKGWAWVDWARLMAERRRWGEVGRAMKKVHESWIENIAEPMEQAMEIAKLALERCQIVEGLLAQPGWADRYEQTDRNKLETLHHKLRGHFEHALALAAQQAREEEHRS